LANLQQAKKRARQHEKRRLHNTSQKSAMRTTLKKTLITLKKDGKEAAQDVLKKTMVSIDRLAGKNLIHPNKAARLKSRLNKKVNAA